MAKIEFGKMRGVSKWVIVLVPAAVAIYDVIAIWAVGGEGVSISDVAWTYGAENLWLPMFYCAFFGFLAGHFWPVFRRDWRKPASEKGTT